MKKFEIQRIIEDTYIYSVLDYTEQIEFIRKEYEDFLEQEIIPIFENDEDLKKKYIEPEEGEIRELIPIVGYFEHITERFIIRISERDLEDRPDIIKRIKSKIANSKFGRKADNT